MNDKEYNREYYRKNRDRIKAQRKQKAAMQPEKKKRKPGRKKGSGMTEDEFLEKHNDIVMVFEKYNGGPKMVEKQYPGYDHLSRRERLERKLRSIDYIDVREMTGKSIATIGKVSRLLKGRCYNERETPGHFRYPENCGMRGSELSR